MKKKKSKTCLKCGKEFECKSLKAKWCSILCGSRAAYAKTDIEKSCLQCGKTFYARQRKKYCSGKCVGEKRFEHLDKLHKAKRKYPKIDGLNRCQIYRKFNPDKNRMELNKDNLKRVILIQYLGGKCVRCGYDVDIRALQLDHIKGDGNVDRKSKGKSGKVYRYYVKNEATLQEASANLQVLCANCHAIKTVENGEY